MTQANAGFDLATSPIVKTTSWAVTCITTLSHAATSVAVPGATLGDYVIPSVDVDPIDCMLDANVTAADVVTAVLFNGTGANISTGAGLAITELNLIVIPKNG